MAVGDTNYTIVKSGSTAASANTPHHFMGAASGGLSDLGTSSVFVLWVKALTNGLRVTPTNGTQYGFLVGTSETAYTRIPAMHMANLSQVHFLNDTAGANATVQWILWNRRG